jgi:hypothetical protein
MSYLSKVRRNVIIKIDYLFDSFISYYRDTFLILYNDKENFVN